MGGGYPAAVLLFLRLLGRNDLTTDFAGRIGLGVDVHIPLAGRQIGGLGVIQAADVSGGPGPPVGLLGPHTASLGMRFYTGSMFPKEYKDVIFVAQHGSWNRTNKAGGDVAVVKLNKDGTVKSVEPFLTGFIQNNKYVGRPVDVMQLKDGSLLVSDDWNGAVYRITYGKKVAGK